jgi:hypothetical protein
MGPKSKLAALARVRVHYPHDDQSLASKTRELPICMLIPAIRASDQHIADAFVWNDNILPP